MRLLRCEALDLRHTVVLLGLNLHHYLAGSFASTQALMFARSSDTMDARFVARPPQVPFTTLLTCSVQDVSERLWTHMQVR